MLDLVREDDVTYAGLYNLYHSGVEMEQMPQMMQYWPLSSPPRANQIKAMHWLENIPHDVKYIILELPVGGGKSAIAVAYSRWLSRSKRGDSYILTSQRSLQTQYKESFPDDVSVVYGQSFYTCGSTGLSCDIVRTSEALKCNCACQYDTDISNFNNTGNGVLNFQMALTHFKPKIFKDIVGVNDTRASALSYELGKRKLMVVDEAHTMENVLCNFESVAITKEKCDRIGIDLPDVENMDIASAVTWLVRDYQPVLKNYSNRLSAIADVVVKGGTLDEEFSKEYTEVNQELLAITTLTEKSIVSGQTHVFSKITDGKTGLVTGFSVKPLHAEPVFKAYVEPLADRFLFMSSTILGKEAFCKDFGLDADKTAFLSLPSEFPVDNRPVIYAPLAKMTFGWDKDNYRRGRMVEGVVEILGAHSEESGILHTNSFNIAEFFISELSGKIPHRIVHHQPDSGIKRDDAINDYLESAKTKPTILISPSITEGLDLVGDLGRFSIIAKIPYPYLGDEWVKKRSSLDGGWYNRRAFIAILQASGRVVRSSEDWGYTYIVDSSFDNIYARCGDIIPYWWAESLQSI